MRVCSFLPSATEILYALGVGEAVVAVSHECDYPPEAQRKPIVSRARVDHTQLDSLEIDPLVAQTLRRGESLYTIDREVLRHANPDLLVTQELCDVCAVTGNDLSQSLNELQLNPKIVTLTPTTLAGIFENVRTLGEAVGLRERAERLVDDLTARVARVASMTQDLTPRPTVFCLEWLDPPSASGHWTPERVALAGGTDPLGRPGENSVRIRWEAIVAAAPEILVLMPCGFESARAVREARRLEQQPGWDSLPAVRQDRVYVTDASAYFSRPGPRVVDGLEILAHIINPERFPAQYPPSVLQHLPQHQPLRREEATPRSSGQRLRHEEAAPRPSGQRRVA